MSVNPEYRNIPPPSVSVVIPAFNSAATIAQTVESVLSQSVTDLEVIICDDNSTDATVEIVDAICKKDSRVQISRTSENFGGPAAPRNRGIELARGEWLAFLDSDDLWMQHKLKTQLMVALEMRADFICSGIRDFTGSVKDGDLKGLPSLDWPPVAEELTYKKLLLKSTISTSTVLIKSKVLRESCLKFIEDKNYVAVEDYELWLRVLSLPLIKAVKIREPLGFYRKSDTAISKNKIHMLFKVRRLLSAEVKNRPPIIRKLLLSYLLSHYLVRSVYYRLFLKRM